MEDVSVAIIALAILTLAFIGVLHIAGDSRSFETIIEQCEKQGFIQNKITRIKCEVEK